MAKHSTRIKATTVPNHGTGSLTSAITEIQVDDLFGLYTYKLCPPLNTRGAPGRLLILYGDNGSGKTTLLRLIYHLLSKEDNRGHRTFLATVPFRRLAVRIGDNVVVSARREREQLTGSYILSVARDGHKPIEILAATDDSNVIRISEQSAEERTRWQTFIDALTKLQLTLYYLPDDRKLESPFHTPDEYRSTGRSETEASLIHRHLLLMPDIAPPTPPLEAALQRTNDWIREEALRGSNEGQANTNSIYAGIVSQLAQAGPKHKRRPKHIGELKTQLLDLERRSKTFSSFGLTSPLKIEDLTNALATAPQPKRSIIEDILRPYIDGMAARLDALQRLQRLLTLFLTALNGFFTNKTLAFDLARGFEITARNGAHLSPSALSSGEKQLLLLFCNAITARNAASIFLIDEPELSLNIKWQRKLLSALMALVSDSTVQFVAATHSIELLSGYRSHVLPLTDAMED